jgi:hypothetical protein
VLNIKFDVKKGEAGSPRHSRKLRHDRRRARQRAKREGMVLPMKREDGTLDLTPHIASLDMLTKGRYLEIGRGFLVRNSKV